MYHKPFSSRALPDPAGGAYSTPTDPLHRGVDCGDPGKEMARMKMKGMRKGGGRGRERQ